MIEHLLRYHSDQAQHHRQKITFLAGIYLAFSQLLILTPKSTVDQLLATLDISDCASGVLIFGGGVGSFFILLLIGICHHVCNLITSSTQRLKYEMRCVWKDHKESKASWLPILDSYTRNRFSLSQVSAYFAIVFIIVLFLLTSVRFASITTRIFSSSIAVGAFLGGYFTIEAVILVFYFSIALRRCKQFYTIRRILRGVEGSRDLNGLCGLLDKIGIVADAGKIRNYDDSVTNPE